MKYRRTAPAWVILATALTMGSGPAMAQKSGGILKVYHRDTPPSGSIHEEATNSTVMPYMGVFNNLVMFDQDKPKNSMETIVPDLATSWSWSDDGTKLTFKLREGVKWHDGKPFTAKDVACTFDMLLEKAQGRSSARTRASPGTPTWSSVTADGDYQATFDAEATAAGVPDAARLGLHAGLSVPRVAQGHAHEPDRHRAVQVRGAEAERVDQVRQERRTTGRRAGPTWTASSTPSSRAARPACWASSPASST